MTRARRAALIGAALVLAATGCSSSGNSAQPTEASSTPTSAPPSSSASAEPSCPAAGAGVAWPKGVPAGMPVPPGLEIVSLQRQPNLVVRFTVPQDFHATVRYLLDALPRAGFTLGTGDAEAEEADIPLSRGSEHASFKINDQASCVTGGLLALGTD